ncbi:type II toxin-antitoxin system RelE/ParE family toxin [Paenibacillus sp. 453mf]|uniref:type II toxin-antitoxin system RelE/ParE family toxin n=1 Tax=Paenibacillus sp. 453mf TaxID=1761874 RepID=UPI0008E0C40D|nr:type II toxin-antitoxin system RelE/ParE family toxin [Paenibacillus sp. 453mf]SFS56824.1 addiction module toxin, RelE/StbE family [Paenibacillus sp. 453mf]
MAELVWSPRSLKDLEIIYEYIKQDSIEQAREFVNELIYETSTIIDFPYKGRLVPELNRDEVREKIYKSYRIIYRITETNIELVTFLHQSRRLIKQEYK